MCKCESNGGQHLHYFDYGEDRIFIVQSGAYIQIFDDEYPGFSDAFLINYCPVCGRKLREVETDICEIAIKPESEVSE